VYEPTVLEVFQLEARIREIGVDKMLAQLERTIEFALSKDLDSARRMAERNQARWDYIVANYT
jgi:hypothetical protein